MRKLFSIFAAVVIAAAPVIFSSCSDSDDSGSLDTPKYEQDAALYQITDRNSPYASIELSASGNYIITPSEYVNYSSLAKAKTIFSGKAKQLSRSDWGVIYGKYVKTGENEYRLDGFGTIKIETNGGNAVDIDITTNNGNSIVVGANRSNMYASSEMTDKLCRTWKIDKVRVAVWEDGRKIFDKKMSMAEFVKEEEGEDYDDEIPDQVMFSKAGTYVVFYTNHTLAVSTWCWENESKGIARYSWDYDYLFDPDESGSINVKFSGNSLTISEEFTDVDHGEEYTELVEYYMSEVK